MAIVENNPEQTWAQNMLDLLDAIHKRRQELREAGDQKFDDAEFQQVIDRLHALIFEGNELNPHAPKSGKRGRTRQTKIRNLLDRLEKRFDEFFSSLQDVTLPYSNNVAEQSFRMFKVKMKVSGNFVSLETGQLYVRLYSYVETARKHGVNAYDALLLAIKGEPEKALFVEAA